MQSSVEHFFIESSRVYGGPGINGRFFCDSLVSVKTFFKNLLKISLGVVLFQPSYAKSFKFAGRTGTYSPATFGDGDSIPNRSMHTLPLSFFSGYRWRKIQFGLAAEYAKNWQAVEPEVVNDQNAGGASNALGVELQWIGKKWGISVGYRGMVNYSFANTDSLGNSVTYHGSGYSIGLMRTVRKSFGIYIDGTFDSFSKMNEQSLSPNVQVARFSLGLIVGNFWK